MRAQGGSQALFVSQEHANLFLASLDDEQRWYRYHHFFAEALYQRLQQTAPTLVPELHPRASRWYEQHELFAEAISHALAAPALEEAARLIEQCIWTFIVGSQLQTLYEWLQSLLTHFLQKITQELLLLGTGSSLRGQLCFSEVLS